MFENDNNDFGFFGKNHGLNKQDIEERDEYLKNIKKEITEFMSIADIDLPVNTLALALSPGTPDNVVYSSSKQPVFGMHWIYDTVIPKIKSYVLTAVKEKAFHNLETEAFLSPSLRGSPYAIARKLIRKNVLGINYNTCFSQPQNNDEGFEELKVIHVELTPDKIIENIAREYEERYMRYRLWNDNALSTLADYLFFDYKNERDDIELPAMSEDIDGAPLSKEDLIAEAHASIHLYYDRDGTEVSYPLNSENGYIFSEYLPLNFAEDSVKNQLYDYYLNACKNR